MLLLLITRCCRSTTTTVDPPRSYDPTFTTTYRFASYGMSACTVAGTLMTTADGEAMHPTSPTSTMSRRLDTSRSLTQLSSLGRPTRLDFPRAQAVDFTAASEADVCAWRLRQLHRSQSSQLLQKRVSEAELVASKLDERLVNPAARLTPLNPGSAGTAPPPY